MFVTDETWYCSLQCATVGGASQDHLRNYSISTVWNGLLDIAYADMVKEGDGLAIMSMWRLNMIRFWIGGHNKYLIIGHRLLAGKDSTWILSYTHRYKIHQ